jgi:hypothetical protein
LTFGKKPNNRLRVECRPWGKIGLLVMVSSGYGKEEWLTSMTTPGVPFPNQ